MNRDEQIGLLTELTAGLLASGHFTAPEDDNEIARVLTCDVGPDWKEDGEFPHRHVSLVTEVAERLLKEIIFAANRAE